MDMDTTAASPIQSSPSPSPSSSPSRSPSASPSNPNPNSFALTPDPSSSLADTPTVALPPPATIALPPPSLSQHQQPLSLPPPVTAVSTRRVPPPCWSVEETVALIDAYQEKWYSLRRGNLRANHWQEVADAVTSRCHNLPGSSLKTAVQCRHKVEKLRKRYRSERERFLKNRRNSNPNSSSRNVVSSSWVFFRKMEAMELGPMANNNIAAANYNNIKSAAAAANYNNIKSAAAAASGNNSYHNTAILTGVPRHKPPPSPSPSESSSNDEESDDEDDNHGVGNNRNIRSLHGLVSNGSGMKFKIPKAVRSRGNMLTPRTDERMASGVYPGSGYPSSNYGSGSRFGRGLYDAMGLKPGGNGMEEMRRRLENKRCREREEGSGMGGGNGLTEIVAAVRMLGDGFMRMEQMKMDMEREIHNMRMEMELKHSEMILDTQRRIVDTFLNGYVGKKRTRNNK